MITAVDTNVLLDVFTANPDFGTRSRAALLRCQDEGALVVCDVVLAELTAAFGTEDAVTAALRAVGATYSISQTVAAIRAGQAWRTYRAGGGPRSRVIADFLVAAHAREHADRLLTRDRGFVRTHFADLSVLDPADSD
ncbi:MAG: type II toxin-antitoxin system VapC family toxin [Kineosporiaceae bacterium]|nr:type II toxin-antitoxin system VapC family toxin [Kineosporiaceae bacterium]